ncbi:uncharacterized protein [Haliotis asinina]|uniref:uncharacterized protein n=1 Tax=Haliotis asinina TaxID=109174 RepID=UPI0035318914
MAFTTKNLVIAFSYAFLQGFSINKAKNIMQGKPSELSSVHWNAEFANDGKNYYGSFPAWSDSTVNPYWKGDLQGYFTVHKISVTSDDFYGLGKDLGGAYVEVATTGNSGCLNDVFICGQCPEVVGNGETFTFNCSHPRPVRFVKVWRNLTGEIAISEVVVKGTQATTRVTKYNKAINTKVSTPMTSLAVTSAADCSTRCYANTTCQGFSYHPTVALNCLLATNPEDSAADVGWSKYTLDRCSSYDSCDRLTATTAPDDAVDLTSVDFDFSVSQKDDLFDGYFRSKASHKKDSDVDDGYAGKLGDVDILRQQASVQSSR